MSLNKIIEQMYEVDHKSIVGALPKEEMIHQKDVKRDITDLISYSGGEWDNGKYSSFIPDTDNCMPITDEEYFEDDVVGRFVEFVKVVFGNETLEEDLGFIAKALETKGKLVEKLSVITF